MGPAQGVVWGIDPAMACVIAFVAFFFGLVFFHLRREDKREGYPFERPGGTDDAPRLSAGWPPLPRPKTFFRPHGRPPVTVPRRGPECAPGAGGDPAAGGALRPEADGLSEGLGPAAWSEREDLADLNVAGEPKIVPLGRHTQYFVAAGDPDPRGWRVVSADGAEVGEVVDLWFNRAEFFLRYLEVKMPGRPEPLEGARPQTSLLPLFFARLDRKRKRVIAHTMTADRFAEAPRHRFADRVTLLDEDRANAFFAGGRFFREGRGGRS